MSLNQFMNQYKDKARNCLERLDMRPQAQVRQGTQSAEYEDALNKISVQIFSGIEGIATRSRVHKLHTFLALKPIKERTIQLATIHLEGVAYDWWYQGLVSRDHTHDSFLRRVY